MTNLFDGEDEDDFFDDEEDNYYYEDDEDDLFADFNNIDLEDEECT